MTIRDAYVINVIRSNKNRYVQKISFLFPEPIIAEHQTHPPALRASIMVARHGHRQRAFGIRRRMVTSPLWEFVLFLKHDEVQKFMVHLTEEYRPFSATGASRVMVVLDEKFTAFFASRGEKIGAGGLETLEDFDIETAWARGM